MKFETDYRVAQDEAQAKSDETGLLIRLRRTTEYGRTGYVWHFVPRVDKQFGRDLEGELVVPSSLAAAQAQGMYLTVTD